MLNFIPFYTEIWSDKKFRNLTPNKENPEGYGKLIFTYLFTNHSVTLTGIYTLDLDEFKMRIPIKDFDIHFNEVIRNGMIKWDKENEVVFVINRFKYIPNNKSPKILEGIVKELNKLNHPFKNEFLEKYGKCLVNYQLLLDKEKKPDNGQLLNEEQITSFVNDLKWDKNRIKKFYIDRSYPEQKIDELINTLFSNLK